MKNIPTILWKKEYYSVHSSSSTSAPLLLNLCTPSATVITFLSSKRCITWRLKSYLCDWLSSSNSKDEIEGRGHGHGHGTRRSANVAANSIMSLSKYGNWCSNVGNMWTSLLQLKSLMQKSYVALWFSCTFLETLSMIHILDECRIE